MMYRTASSYALSDCAGGRVRLTELAADQLEAVCLRVQAFQPEIALAWSAADADLLISAWRKFREQR